MIYENSQKLFLYSLHQSPDFISLPPDAWSRDRALEAGLEAGLEAREQARRAVDPAKTHKL